MLDMTVIGVDPGLDGAFVSYNPAGLLVVEIGPYTQAAPGKAKGRVVDWPMLVQAIGGTWGGQDNIVEDVDGIFIEDVASRPGQGVASMFKFGYICGCLRGILEAGTFSKITPVRPQKWKKHFGLGGDKAESYDLACDIFSSQRNLFATPRGRIKDGVVDAALIAMYGYDTLKGEQ